MPLKKKILKLAVIKITMSFYFFENAIKEGLQIWLAYAEITVNYHSY